MVPSRGLGALLIASVSSGSSAIFIRLATDASYSLYNYALGAVKIVTANLFPLLEPVIASLFAVVVFSEVPTLTEVAGYSLILSVVVVVTGLRENMYV